jgi:hypothetical protein
MIIFGGQQVQIMGIIYVLMPVIMAIVGFVFFVGAIMERRPVSIIC